MRPRLKPVLGIAWGSCAWAAALPTPLCYAGLEVRELAAHPEMQQMPDRCAALLEQVCCVAPPGQRLALASV